MGVDSSSASYNCCVAYNGITSLLHHEKIMLRVLNGLYTHMCEILIRMFNQTIQLYAKITTINILFKNKSYDE